MDSEHISSRFLEDIQYGYYGAFDWITIDNLIYLELYCEILNMLLGVITEGMPFIRNKEIRL